MELDVGTISVTFYVLGGVFPWKAFLTSPFHTSFHVSSVLNPWRSAFKKICVHVFFTMLAVCTRRLCSLTYYLYQHKTGKSAKTISITFFFNILVWNRLKIFRSVHCWTLEIPIEVIPFMHEWLIEWITRYHSLVTSNQKTIAWLVYKAHLTHCDLNIHEYIRIYRPVFRGW
jgi:hypothetical protein